MKRYLEKNGIRNKVDLNNPSINPQHWENKDELKMCIRIHQRFIELKSFLIGIDGEWDDDFHNLVMIRLEDYIEFLEDEIYGVDTSSVSIPNDDGLSKEDIERISVMLEGFDKK